MVIDPFILLDIDIDVITVSIQIGDMWYTTSFDNAGFMDCLKATVSPPIYIPQAY